jgi:hypothetical protein
MTGTGNCCAAACKTGGTCGATSCDATGACVYPVAGMACGGVGTCDGAGTCILPCGTAVGSKCVFVSNATVKVGLAGQLTSAAAADALCAGYASAAGLGGTFKAWVSDSVSSPSTRFSQSAIPYKTTTGLRVAANWTALISGMLENAILFDQYGGSQAIMMPFLVWTGTTTAGITAGATCLNWTSGSIADFAEAGMDTLVTGSWTANGAILCTGSSRIYCFEQ